VVAGFLTFVLGQIFLRLVVEPVNDFKRHVSEIAHSLIEYAALLSNLPVPEEKAPEVKAHFRQLASKIQATFYLIPRYEFTARLFALSSRQAVHAAASKLIGLSNSVYDESRDASIRSAYEQQEICDALGIYVPPNTGLQPIGTQRS
jgi:hypothetical protein